MHTPTKKDLSFDVNPGPIFGILQYANHCDFNFIKSPEDFTFGPNLLVHNIQLPDDHACSTFEWRQDDRIKWMEPLQRNPFHTQ